MTKVGNWLEVVQFLIHEVGAVYPKNALTDEQSIIVEAAQRCGLPRGPARNRCYRNAQKLVIGDESGRLIYVEGFLGGALHHAWAAIDGVAVDVTLPDDQDSYAGLPFAREAVERRLDDRCASFLEDWGRGCPMLTDPEIRATMLHGSVRSKLANLPTLILRARASRPTAR